MDLITRDFSAIDHVATLTLIEQHGDLKLRVYVKRDSYAAQSFARVEVWSPTDLRWNLVHATEAGDDFVVGLPDAYAYRAAVRADGPNAAVIEGRYDTVAGDLMELALRVVA